MASTPSNNTPQGSRGFYGIKSFNKYGMPDQMVEDALYTATSVPGISTVLGRFLLNGGAVTVGQLYKAFANEAIVSSAVKITMLILANSVGDYHHPNPDIKKLIRGMLDDLGGIELYRSMSSAVWAGFFTGYKVWGVSDEGYNVIDRIVKMPPTTLQPTVDQEGIMDGMLQYTIYPSMNGVSWFTQGGYESQERGSMPYPIRNYFPMYAPFITFARDELLHISFTLSGMYNPFGESLILPAYQYYSLKSTVMQVYPLALSRATTPLLAVYADQNQFSNRDDSNNQLEHFKKYGMTWDDFASQIENISVASSLLLPGKKGEVFDAEALSTDSNAIAQFQEFARYLDEQIRESLLIPSTTMRNSGGGSYALGSVHDKKQRAIINSLRSTVVQSMLDDIVKPVIQANFGNQETYGKFVEVDSEVDSRIKVAQFYNEANQAGITDTFRNPEDSAMSRMETGMEGMRDTVNIQEPYNTDPGTPDWEDMYRISPDEIGDPARGYMKIDKIQAEQLEKGERSKKLQDNVYNKSSFKGAPASNQNESDGAYPKSNKSTGGEYQRDHYKKRKI